MGASKIADSGAKVPVVAGLPDEVVSTVAAESSPVLFISLGQDPSNLVSKSLGEGGRPS